MKYEHLEIVEVSCRCCAGSHINACLREAILMAFDEMRKVRFVHNDKQYVVNPEELANAVYSRPTTFRQ